MMAPDNVRKKVWLNRTQLSFYILILAKDIYSIDRTAFAIGLALFLCDPIDPFLIRQNACIATPSRINENGILGMGMPFVFKWVVRMKDKQLREMIARICWIDVSKHPPKIIKLKNHRINS